MKNIRNVTAAAVIGALYASLSLLLGPLSFGPFRLSEALCLLPFSFKPAVWGLFAGCLLTNLASPAGALDIVFGSLATLISGWMISRLNNRFLAPIPLAAVNGVMVGAVLAYTGTPDHFLSAFAFHSLTVAAGELAVGYVAGLPVLALFRKLFPSIAEQ